MYPSLSTQALNPQMAHLDTAPVVHWPVFWVSIALLIVAVLYVGLCYYLAKKNLFAPFCPKTRITITSYRPDPMGQSEQTGCLLLPLPYLVLATCGQASQPRFYSLYHYKITRYGEDISIGLSNLRRRFSGESFFPKPIPDTPIPPTPIPPSPVPEPAEAHIREFINRNRFYASRLPLGLDGPAPQIPFGTTSQTIHMANEEVASHPAIWVNFNPAPAASVPYMVLGPTYTV
ncbi:hypothetical protein FRC12_014346 [Ceratobasidium sp. 428]|nr:hypothetical protein FRC12_014346 [Ceratobasidium sp. 428]